MLNIKNRFRAACLVSLILGGVLVCDTVDGRGFGGRGGGYGGGGYRGGFAASGRTGPGGFGPGYYRTSGYTRGQVANTYGAMGYSPYGYGSLYSGYGLGYGGYGGAGYYPGYYPYYSGSNYNYNYNYNPSEYLQGAADVYNAQGNFLVKQAEAQKYQQEAKSAQLENQRKAFDQAIYEREHTPTAAEVREKELEDSYRRSMSDPPLSLIVSGQALNDLLVGLAQKLDPSKALAEIPLDQSMLRQVGVTSGAQRTNASMLQDGGKVDWPILLRGAEQKKLDTLLPAAVGQVIASGMVDPKVMTQINDELDNMTDHLDSQVNSGEITPNQHIQANRFLNNLKTALRALKQPNAKDYFNGTITARGESVPQLVQNMTKNNLRFTTAMPGQEEAYVNLHHAMVAQAVQSNDVGTASADTGFRVRVGPSTPTDAAAEKQPDAKQ